MQRNPASLARSLLKAPLPPVAHPGSTPPAHLVGKLPADFGFDPLGLGSDPAKLKWNVESELVHSRWAMAGEQGGGK